MISVVGFAEDGKRKRKIQKKCPYSILTVRTYPAHIELLILIFLINVPFLHALQVAVVANACVCIC
jgi:hypothetical protein